MHERLMAKGPKHKALDTVLYEIDVLRHCSNMINDKKAAFEKTKQPVELFEYNSTIEGFLLHTRILLNFFIGQTEEITDLGISQPIAWADRDVNPREYSDLMKSALTINNKYGDSDPKSKKNLTCCKLISRFLAHCTRSRHEWERRWDVEAIFKDMELIMTKFEKRFAAAAVPAVLNVSTMVSNSTTVARIMPPLIVDGNS
jgi:hypothetical protein